VISRRRNHALMGLFTSHLHLRNASRLELTLGSGVAEKMTTIDCLVCLLPAAAN
jgi:hypothetical protein